MFIQVFILPIPGSIKKLCQSEGHHSVIQIPDIQTLFRRKRITEINQREKKG